MGSKKITEVYAEALDGQAARDAQVFASEFPGEMLDPASTDWDSTAWEMARAALRIEDRLADELWPVYQAALLKHVALLVAPSDGEVQAALEDPSELYRGVRPETLRTMGLALTLEQVEAVVDGARLVWIVAPQDQGQTVERAYSSGVYDGVAFMRALDRSDGSVAYVRIELDDDEIERWDPVNGRLG